MRFYDVPAEKAGLYLLPFALGNVLGPLVIGHLFDTIGRKPMITATYIISGLLLAITGWLFHAGLLTAQTQTIAWMVIFFIASAAASSAYLTVSEIFPLEIRAFAIAIFYAVGTLAGGVGAPILFRVDDRHRLEDCLTRRLSRRRSAHDHRRSDRSLARRARGAPFARECGRTALEPQLRTVKPRCLAAKHWFLL